MVSTTPTSDLAFQKIVSALNNKKYRNRTISGISVETGLTKSAIVEAIIKNGKLKKTVKIIPIRSQSGKVLLTTKDRFAGESTFKEKFIDFFSSHRVEVTDAD